jgi:hypothetical protein
MPFSTAIDITPSKVFARSTIFESNSITDLRAHCDKDTVAVYDLDNTTYYPPKGLGSASWYKHFLIFAFAKLHDEFEAREATITIHRAVQYTIDVQLVDPAFKTMHEELKQLHIHQIALTARGDDIADITDEQLRKVNIDFAGDWDHRAFYFEVDEDRKAYFKNGVIYCSGYDKGKCLMAFFKAIGVDFEKIAMADDEAKNLHAVKEAVEKKGGSFTGLRYAFLDDMADNFNLEEVNNQLIEIRCRLSNEAKKLVDRLYTTPSQKHARARSLTMHSVFSVTRGDAGGVTLPADRLEMIFNLRSGR